MKYKERRAKLDKLEKAIDKELAYDKDESYPDKYDINEKLISGDEYAKKMVIDTYKNMNTLYALFDPAYHSLNFVFIIMPIILNLFGMAMLLISLIRGDDNAVMAMIIETGFVFLGYIVIKNVKSKKMYVYMYQEDGKNIFIYKHVKKDIFIVYMNKKQIYRYADEEWQQIEKANRMGARLMFQYLCGELMVKEHKNGIVEIFCRNRAPLEFKIRRQYEKSAEFFIKNGKPWIINYYPPVINEQGHSRSATCEQLEILEMNTDRVAEVPKSFLTFCQKRGIEPLKENEHLHYV